MRQKKSEDYSLPVGSENNDLFCRSHKKTAEYICTHVACFKRDRILCSECVRTHYNDHKNNIVAVEQFIKSQKQQKENENLKNSVYYKID